MPATGTVAVVGGGPAGLAAAWRLVKAGQRVEIYERLDTMGGNVRSELLDGVVVDTAVQMIGSNYTRLRQLLHEIAAERLLVRTSGRDALWREQEIHAIGYGSVTSMAASSALPLGLKLRLATRYLTYLSTHCRGLDVNDLAGSGGAALDDESIGAWGLRELGDEFVELLAYPFLAAYHGATPEGSSAAFYHALARVGLDVKLYAVRGGTGALTAALAAALETAGVTMRLDTSVEGMHADAHGITLTSAGDDARYSAVVLAVPAAASRALLDGAAEMQSWLEGVRVAGALTLAVVTERPVRAGWFGLGLPRRTRAGARVAAVCLPSSKATGQVPADRGAVLLLSAPAAVQELLAAAPDDVPAQMLPALDAVLPGLSRNARAMKVYRHPESHTQFYPGYIRHLVRLKQEWLPERVALAGDYLVAPTVEGAVMSGERAAERLLRVLRH